MNLHNEDVKFGDRVYDIIRGYGVVIKLHTNLIEVDFTIAKIQYTSEGYQKGKPTQTLFWDKPYIIAPTKNSDSWIEKKIRFDAILNLLKTFNV